MILLGDEAQVEGRFSPFGDSGNLAQDSAQFAPSVLEARILFWTHQM
jgi:hypothetical protein